MATREEWAKRAQRWNDSDLTASELAAEQGINARTLSYWKCKLGKEALGGEPKHENATARSLTPSTTFVEVTPPASVWAEASSSIEVVDERYVVRVSDALDPSTLARVLTAIEEAAVGPVDDEELLVPGAQAMAKRLGDDLGDDGAPLSPGKLEMLLDDRAVAEAEDLDAGEQVVVEHRSKKPTGRKPIPDRARGGRARGARRLREDRGDVTEVLERVDDGGADHRAEARARGSRGRARRRNGRDAEQIPRGLAGPGLLADSL